MTVQTQAPAYTTSSKPQTDTLTAADRCDRCSGQAFVRVVLPSELDLLFCRHHYLKHEPALAGVVDYVVDETWKLYYNRHKGSENS